MAVFFVDNIFILLEVMKIIEASHLPLGQPV